ncbi:phage terminase large subunit, partial [Streptomyces sp. F8]|uniref:phage terminase large subunit n=1 Tax=Streptomyces sp. F8 TaxID=1436085 RepID=UPI0029CC926E
MKIVQTTHGTKNGVGRIRGMTAFGAYVNETSLANESVFEEIKARCSGKGARIIADTNPSHPEHWLKKNYIDSDSPSIRSFNFVLEDNTFLSQRYIDNLKASTPSGMFY